MKERPILFSGEMIRAILDGRKTQTRRVCKAQPENRVHPIYVTKYAWGDKALHPYMTDGVQIIEYCPYGKVGDQLWVRETFRQAYPKTEYSDGIIYRADKAKSLGMAEYCGKWRPSIFMPRSASRIQLEITNVRVERLQDIEPTDACSEGILPLGAGSSFALHHLEYKSIECGKFADLWDSINAAKHPWESNPWVWVVEFKPVEQGVSNG